MPERRPPPYEGGCLCGAVRYRITAAPLNVRICHCRICQKLTGSAFYARAVFPREAVEATGETRGYKSSEELTRRFCPTCGSSLFAERPQNLVSVTLGTFDDPESFVPEAQVFTRSRMCWLPADEDLPGFETWVS